jgi:hypothetical protein
MSLETAREEAAEALFDSYDWADATASVGLAWSNSDCGTRLLRPVIINGEIGQFEVAFDPDTADVAIGGAWLNGEPVGQVPEVACHTL